MTNTGSRATRPQSNDNGQRRRSWDETRLFAKTSEFWAMLVVVAAIVVIYNAAADTSLDLWRACLLGVVLAVSYIVSRGFAKAGTPTPTERRENDHDHDGNR